MYATFYFTKCQRQKQRLSSIYVPKDRALILRERQDGSVIDGAQRTRVFLAGVSGTRPRRELRAQSAWLNLAIERVKTHRKPTPNAAGHRRETPRDFAPERVRGDGRLRGRIDSRRRGRGVGRRRGRRDDRRRGRGGGRWRGRGRGDGRGRGRSAGVRSAVLQCISAAHSGERFGTTHFEEVVEVVEKKSDSVRESSPMSSPAIEKRSHICEKEM